MNRQLILLFGNQRTCSSVTVDILREHRCNIFLAGGGGDYWRWCQELGDVIRFDGMLYQYLYGHHESAPFRQCSELLAKHEGYGIADSYPLTWYDTALRFLDRLCEPIDVLKHPGMCLCWDLWKRVIPKSDHTVTIGMMLRNPYQIAKSYERRDRNRGQHHEAYGLIDAYFRAQQQIINEGEYPIFPVRADNLKRDIERLLSAVSVPFNPARFDSIFEQQRGTLHAFQSDDHPVFKRYAELSKWAETFD